MADDAVREIEVFGRRLLLEWTGVAWVAYEPGADGKRRLTRDILIPGFVRTEAEVEQYLADLLHERASPGNRAIRWCR
ncbi:MAG: hypothetical protein WKG32_04160 [Gemmatimonadaceae bacterium]